MAHLISTLVDLVLLPSNLIALAGLLGLLALPIGWRRVGVTLAALSIAALAVAGWSPLAAWALGTLENRFPVPRIEEPVAGIVMLGGAVNVHIAADRGAPALNEAGERVTAVATLARRFPEADILLSGGAGDRHREGAATESALARDLLVAMGVAPARIALEERSMDTCENARESARLAAGAAGQSWLLVTSASHMPRAVACFRAAGFAVVPYPVDYRTRDSRMRSVAEGLSLLDLAAHEWLGLVGYRALGRTAELFPSP